jgi:peptidoglycan/LPS O-acetylase OafA/YrhL
MNAPQPLSAPEPLLMTTPSRPTAWRALWDRAPSRIQSLDGLRALSVIWMIAFHSMYFLGFAVPREAYLELIARPSTYLLQQGHFGVDVFFVLSGFLITSMLLREHHTRGRLSLASFYVRRLSRVLPAYVVVLALWGLLVRERSNIQHAWANLLLINNFFSVEWQALPWSWSLAIEEQFYLLFPVLLLLLLRSRRPFAWLGALLVIGVLITAALLVHHRFFEPIPAHITFDAAAVNRYFDIIYEKTYTRFGGLVVGVFVAFAAERAEWLRAVAARPRTATTLLVCALAGLGFYVFRSAYTPREAWRPTWQLVLDLATYRTSFAVLVGYVLFYVLARSQGGASGGLLGRVLGARAFVPFAELSYSAYLVHPLIAGIVYFAMAPKTTDFSALAPVFATIFVMTWLVSFFIYWLVEFPCRERGRRLARRFASLSVATM